MNAYSIPGIQRDIENEILKSVCRVFGTKPEIIKQDTKTRKRSIVVTRQVTMSVIRRRTNKSFREIGEFFNKDHATALHAVRTVDNLRETDKRFRALTNELFER